MKNRVLKVVILQTFLLVNCLNNASNVFAKNKTEDAKIGQTDTVVDNVCDSTFLDKNNNKTVTENKRQLED